MEKTQELHKPTKIQPIENTSFVSKVFFCWAPLLFYRSYRQSVSEEYYAPLEGHTSGLLGKKLEDAWDGECGPNGSKSLWNALRKVFFLELICLGVIFILPEFVLKMSQPWLIGKLMTYIVSQSWEDTYIFGTLIILTNFLTVTVGHWYQLKIHQVGMKIRVACCSLIYRKALKMNAKAAASWDVGKIKNLLSNDVNRFDLGTMHTLQLLKVPFETIFVIYCLYTSAGATAVSGIIVLLLFIPTQMYMGRLTTRYRQRTATKTKHRIKLMDEIISGIEVIKMFTWEKLFTKKITEARKEEIRQIRKISLVRAFNVSAQIFLNRMGIFCCIFSYALTHREINARYVFVVSSYYAILRQALTVYLPFGIQSFSEARVSVARIRKFLSFDKEFEATGGSNEEEEPLMRNSSDQNTNRGEILMENVSAKWLPSSESYILQDVDLQVAKDELVVITGPVGSGKSTILYTILNELPPSRGRVSVGGTISYSSQDPWLFSGTLRDNILFGSTFDLEKYQKIVQISQLGKDFSGFPEGDQSLVGERGSLLSGGQKNRISLARALYKDADVYLLDDPLSSVDATVAEKIFQDCILTYLKDKCRILVTHNTGYLNGRADSVYVLQQGTLTQDVTHKKFNFVRKNNDEDGPSSVRADGANKVKSPETIKTGKKPKEIYAKYAQAGGGTLLNVTVVALFVLTQIAASGADYFVAFWTNFNGKDFFNTCAIIYVIIITATVIFSLARSVVFFRYCLRASTNLHKQMFSSIVRAPMLFFKKTPAEQILNRFSKDQGLIDETLPHMAMDALLIALVVLGSLLLVSFVNPWMLFPSAVVFGLFYVFKIVFLARSRNIKRLEAEARSPISSHMHSTLQGLSTIRTFNVQKILEGKFDNYQDLHTSAFYFFLTSNRAFGFWLDMTCAIYAAIAISATLLMDTTAGNVGLSITQSINLIGVLQFGIRQWSELENQMISVERVLEYTEIEQESDSGNKQIEDCERNGNIKFQSVSLRYVDRNSDSLDDINLEIKAGEKIGIVGRTGGGKSSLISTFFRLYDLEGNIFIDGVNIKHLWLEDLRSKISIIPQQSMLFTGSLRDNIDPDRQFNDNDIWKVLEEVKLKKVVADLPENLHHQVARDGGDFSVGQRQLICLARAILRKNKILIMDEATADVDLDTETAIHQTIKTKMQDCTILIVAHRLTNVMDLDRIVVIEDGEIVESGTPQELLENPQSSFSQLVRKNEETGDEIPGENVSQ